MPKWSGVYETIGNGNLGIQPTSPVGTILGVGPCSSGTDNEVYYYSKADSGKLREELGYGDLVDRLMDFFALCGQKAKAIVVPAEKDVAGSASLVTGGYSGPIATLAGASAGTFKILVEILTGGAHETATFRYSIDDGTNWSDAIATPAVGVPYALDPTGVTIAWAAGTFVEGEVYDIISTSPSCTLSSILAALDAGLATKMPFEYACVLTPSDSTSWAGLGVWADGLFDAHKSVRVLTEAPFEPGTETYTADLLTEMSGFAHDRVSITAGIVRCVDAKGYTLYRGMSGLVAGLIAASPVYRSVGNVKYCKLTPVLSMLYPETDGELQSLDTARYIVPRTYEGLQGFWVNNGNVAALSTSDFQSIELCRVLDNIIRNVRVTALNFVHSEVKVVDGVADPSGLKALEGACQGTLIGLSYSFSSARITIPEGQDIIATQEINAFVSVVPFGYMKAINIGFSLVKL